MGVISLGIFASTAINSAGANGLLHGNAPFFFKQVIAVLGASVYAFLFTYGMLWVINKFTPVKVNDVEEGLGLDEVLHGETAYEV